MANKDLLISDLQQQLLEKDKQIIKLKKDYDTEIRYKQYSIDKLTLNRDFLLEKIHNIEQRLSDDTIMNTFTAKYSALINHYKDIFSKSDIDNKIDNFKTDMK